MKGFGKAAAVGVSALAALLLLAAPAAASLDVFYSQVGTLKLSVDASGSNTGAGTLRVNKPIGATVRKAFLFAASTGFTGYTPQSGDVELEGTPISWDPGSTLVNGIGSANVAADVTDLVTPKIEDAAAGQVEFSVTEESPAVIDGEVLAVVFDDPTVLTNTVYLMYGAQSTSGDDFALGLSEGLKPSTALTMGLGISYGYQPAGQYSTIDVNGERLTTSAGGQDDCLEKEVAVPEFQLCGNGTLITAGGIGDDTSDPQDPFAEDELCLGPDDVPAPRCDDELYNLKPFVASGETSVQVETLNPSADDNVFFASFTLGSAAIVGEGVVLGPTGTRSQVGTDHFLKAFVQGDTGLPEEDREVTLEAVDGPSDGMSLNAVTNSDGIATFNYAASITGTDKLRARFSDDSEVVHESNQVDHTWTVPVNGTFGGEWPYDGNELTLHYSYGGNHRYLGNVFQGVANWNQAGTNVNIEPWPGGAAADHLPFVDVYSPDTWWGVTLFAEDCSTCGYVRNMIALNQRTLDPESDAQRTKVATHELGHALGLEHPYGFVSTSVPSLMWQGLLGGSVRGTPQAFDISRVNGMYP
jgi:hypothetical protein